jgi:nucleoid DNA-binding protein
MQALCLHLFMFDFFKEHDMAAKKRKPTRSTAKKVVKKTTARVAKKSVVKSKAGKTVATAKKAPVKKLTLSSVSKAYTKGQLFTTLAGSTGLQRKEVSTLFDDLGTVIAAHLKKQGPGQFTLPGLLKITIKHKPATKARKGINPFNGEEMMFKAKPARNVVKVRPLQRLKEMV